MGIDARMFVLTKEPVTREQVRRWAFELAECFYAGHDDGAAVSVWRPGRWSWEPNGRHCLEIVKRYEQDGPDKLPGAGETMIQCRLSGRYYGPGYERGDLPTILAIARWLEDKVPGAEVWYGGDSSGVLAEPFGTEQREELWRHFCEHGHRPYNEGWGRGSTAPACDFCHERLTYYGGGAGDSFFACSGCGLRVRRNDSTGATVEADRDWKPVAPKIAAGGTA